MIEQVVNILSYGGAIVAGLLVKLVWDKIKTMEKRAEVVETRADSIETNYINRFERVQTQLTLTKEEIIGKISDLRLFLAENYATKHDVRRRPNKNK